MSVAEILYSIAAVLAAGLLAYAVFIEPFRIRVRELELSFPSLPPAFDGYTILHLSDLHMNRLGKLERSVMRIIGRRPVDTCVVTGDVTANPRAAHHFRTVCSVINHTDPIFMVLGNSEHKPWVDSAKLVQALRFEGLEILNNSHAAIERGADSIRVVGVDDPYSRFADVDTAFEGVEPDSFVVFLTHCPSPTPDGIRRGADLILAGHTHGGQVRLPFVGIVWSHMRRHASLSDGLYQPEELSKILEMDAGEASLFVNRGVGTSRIPIRFCCRPEVVYITLRKGGGH